MSVSPRLLQLFRERHPTGTVVAELLRFDAGAYTVRAEVRIDRNWVLASGLAVHADIEKAEERAIERALQVAGFALFDQRGREPTGDSFALPSAPARPGEVNHAPTNGSLPVYEEEAPSLLASSNGHSYELEPPVDLSDLLAQTDVQMQRIGWSSKEGRDYLQRTFGKNTRSQLEAGELQAFLRHLKSQPNHLPRRNQPAPF
ncbi:hypothetical protein [Gloeobacter kilaueensis]|uniref:3-hexulose-6-phosphate synthase-related protein n=1 Tax=Gloeobacter kilaueensis (strain ATCC BAA-2537 / CCAP 1431/1 / ULC 316 / JS1) TaxID=1183438 RepID=U5QP95_GLOK1|nr:hypothetical protein [Gloeobacter kilaueensis]AGY59480.1 3-hexulose-6-phosphate synthase-related protein [Gloeobacter kilaueensis JS1]